MTSPFDLPAATTPNTRTILQDLASFLKRPRVMVPAGLLRGSSWSALGVLCGVHIAILLLVLLPITALTQQLLGLQPPDAFDTLPEGWLVPITVVFAPVIEEVLFRGWQSGRPRALWLLACAVAGGLVLTILPPAATAPFAALGAMAAVVIAMAAGWFALRRRQSPQAYRRAFPAIYWLAAICFASIHVLNYSDASALTALLVLPQLWAGIMLGFTRQRLGLVAGMLQHAAANGSIMALSLFVQ